MLEWCKLEPQWQQNWLIISDNEINYFRNIHLIYIFICSINDFYFPHWHETIIGTRNILFLCNIVRWWESDSPVRWWEWPSDRRCLTINSCREAGPSRDIIFHWRLYFADFFRKLRFNWTLGTIPHGPRHNISHDFNSWISNTLK